MTFLDVLVPDDPDARDLVSRLRAMRLRDAGAEVDLGPVDEATLRLAFKVLHSTLYDLMIEVPRGEHDAAVLLGIYLQLSRLAASRGLREEGHLAGPIVAIGRNRQLGERLRSIKVGTETLSEALEVQRVRSTGEVTSLDGITCPARAWSTGLFYLNTNLGWPDLGVDVSAVIIDRTSFRSKETFEAAVEWAHSHQASRLIVVSELGDRPEEISSDRSWVYLPWSSGLRRTIREERGFRPARSSLSLNALSAAEPGKITAAVYSAPAVERLRRELLTGAVAARKTGKDFPRSVADAVRLVNVLMTSWGSIEMANQEAALEGRGETAKSLRRRLDQPVQQQQFSGPWSAFHDTAWPDLRRGVISFYDLLAEYNPRMEMLLQLLDRFAVKNPDANLIVRAASASDARAVAREVLQERPALEAKVSSGALVFAAESRRLPWATTETIEIRLGVPAMWRRSSMCGGEATELVVVVDAAERHWLETASNVLHRNWQQSLETLQDRLDLPGLAEGNQSIPIDHVKPTEVDDRGREEQRHEKAPSLTADIDILFSQFQTALYRSDTAAAHAEASTQRLRPVVLEGDATEYLLPAEGSVDVLAGRRYATSRVADLEPGWSLVVSRGDSRRGVYDRLIDLMYRGHEVTTMNLLLNQFRQDVYKVYDHCGGSWPAAANLIKERGGSVSTGLTVKEWATGARIGPEVAEDIKVVARIAGDTNLTRDERWRLVDQVAREFRRLNTELGRCLSAAIREAAQGRPGPNLLKLQEVCGGLELEEVLEEFQVRKIVRLGPAEPAAGRLPKLPRPIDDYLPSLT